jgi:hypothetical protein
MSDAPGLDTPVASSQARSRGSLDHHQLTLTSFLGRVT